MTSSTICIADGVGLLKATVPAADDYPDHNAELVEMVLIPFHRQLLGMLGMSARQHGELSRQVLEELLEALQTDLYPLLLKDVDRYYNREIPKNQPLPPQLVAKPF